MNYYENDNIGSIRLLEIIRHDLPISFNPLYLPIGVTWLAIPFTDEKGEYIIKTEDSDNGPIYNCSGNFFLHNMRDEVDQALLPFCGKAIAIIRITDMNGRVYIIGTPDNPVLLNLSGTTGKKYTDVNGSTYSFSVNQSAAPLAA